MARQTNSRLLALQAPLGSLHTVLAGFVAAIVGFAGSFTLVLAGLRAAGASAAQASSGLLVLCAGMGVLSVLLSVRHRVPISIVWSTPGAALLVADGQVAGGYPAALGAFMACGALIVLTGCWPRLSRLLTAIPSPLASAMLAGVLLPVCLAPAQAVVRFPATAIPGVAVWLLVARVSRRWAVPAAFAATIVAVALHPLGSPHGAHTGLPTLTLTAPAISVGALLGLAVPLFVVTMASQNIPGISVLVAQGYRPPLRRILVSTGAGTALGAPFGTHAFNLAAITAALVAGPDAHADPERRWIASASAGVLNVLLGLCSGLAAVLLAIAPLLVIQSVAGLALLGTLAGALRTAVESEPHREAAIVTFVVSASSITAWGIGAPFWGLAAGIALLALPAVSIRWRGRSGPRAVASRPSRRRSSHRPVDDDHPLPTRDPRL